MELPGAVRPRGAGISLSGPGEIESLRPDGSVIRTGARAGVLNALPPPPLPLHASSCYEQLSHRLKWRKWKHRWHAFSSSYRSVPEETAPSRAARLPASCSKPGAGRRTPKGRLRTSPLGVQLITGLVRVGVARALHWAEIEKTKC